MSKLEFFKGKEIKSGLVSIVGGCHETAVSTTAQCGDQFPDAPKTDHVAAETQSFSL